jgi:hypothetical protein
MTMRRNGEGLLPEETDIGVFTTSPVGADPLGQFLADGGAKDLE